MKTVLFFLAIVLFSLSSQAKDACFKVEGMTCSSCSASIKRALEKQGGFSSISISVEKEEAKVSFDESKHKTSDIAETISKAGYKATSKDCL